MQLAACGASLILASFLPIAPPSQVGGYKTTLPGLAVNRATAGQKRISWPSCAEIGQTCDRHKSQLPMADGFSPMITFQQKGILAMSWNQSAIAPCIVGRSLNVVYYPKRDSRGRMGPEDWGRELELETAR